MRTEFSRPVDIRSLTDRPVRIEADAAERAALAKRFGLVRIDRLAAEVTLAPEGKAIAATGTLEADIVQSCAVSAEDLPVTLSEPIALRFVPAGAPPRPDEEVELDEAALDEIEFSGTQFDLGEAVAQSLALAIDPFLEGPGAEEFRRSSGHFGEATVSPFAALGQFRDPDRPDR